MSDMMIMMIYSLLCTNIYDHIWSCINGYIDPSFVREENNKNNNTIIILQ